MTIKNQRHQQSWLMMRLSWLMWRLMRVMKRMKGSLS